MVLQERCERWTLSSTATDILGWSALVEPHRTTASAVARRETALASISAPELRALCAETPLLGYRLMRGIAKLLAHRPECTCVQLALVG